MRTYLLTLAGLALSILSTGCGINRAASLKMLEQRADYDSAENWSPERAQPSLDLKEGGVEGFRQAPVPVRTRPKVAAIWIHPHETPSHDYFWGGWISIVTETDGWILSQPGLMPKAPGFISAPTLLPEK